MPSPSRRARAAQMGAGSLAIALALAWAGFATAADASHPRASGEVSSGHPVAVVFDGAGPVPTDLRPDLVLALRIDRATRWAARQSRYGSRQCLQFVRLALDVPRKYGTAMDAWLHARHRHRTSFDDIPAGVPVFTRGARSAGHVALSLGGGWVRSTDWPADGKVGDVRLEALLARFAQHYLGWTEDLNGVQVWLPAQPDPDVDARVLRAALPAG